MVDFSGFVKEVMSNFDFAYMLIVNVITYLIIKLIDTWNGNRVVQTWVKRVVALSTGVVIGYLVYIWGADPVTIFYSFIISLVSWDVIFKPIFRLIHIDYNSKSNKR